MGTGGKKTFACWTKIKVCKMLTWFKLKIFHKKNLKNRPNIMILEKARQKMLIKIQYINN